MKLVAGCYGIIISVSLMNINLVHETLKIPFTITFTQGITKCYSKLKGINPPNHLNGGNQPLTLGSDSSLAAQSRTMPNRDVVRARDLGVSAFRRQRVEGSRHMLLRELIA